MSITESAVVELRQYVLKPGAADALVEVFEAELVESQEALGMAIGGLFHDRDDADRFVLRGLVDGACGATPWVRSTRARLEAARPGRQRHDGRQRRRAAAAADGAAAPGARPGLRAPVGARDGLTSGWSSRLAARARPGTCSWLAESVQPLLASALGTTVATWRTEPAENTFPALPVRPEHAFVWAATFADHDAYAAALTASTATPPGCAP